MSKKSAFNNELEPQRSSAFYMSSPAGIQGIFRGSSSVTPEEKNAGEASMRLPLEIHGIDGIERFLLNFRSIFADE